MKNFYFLCFYLSLVIIVSGDDEPSDPIKQVFKPHVNQVTLDLNPLNLLRRPIDYFLAIFGIGSFAKGFLENILEKIGFIAEQRNANFITDILDKILSIFTWRTMSVVSWFVDKSLRLLPLPDFLIFGIKRLINAILVLTGVHLEY